MAASELVCRGFVEQVTDYLEGMLGPVERMRCDAHLAVCPSCVIYLEQMRQTIRAMAEPIHEATSGTTATKLRRRFRRWAASRRDKLPDRAEA